MHDVSGGTSVQSEAVPPPSVAPQATPVATGPPTRSLIWLGAIIALAAAILGALAVGGLWLLTSGAGSGPGAAPWIEGLEYTYAGSSVGVGVGIFLAALGLAQREALPNLWFPVGGTLVLIGSVGSTAVQLYIRALMFGGHFPSFEVLSNLEWIGSGIGLFYPLGLGCFLFGFVARRGAPWPR